MGKPEKSFFIAEEIDSYIYALGVVDFATMDRDKNVDILHAALYQSKPSDKAKEFLLQEMKDDEHFGLSEIAHKLSVVELPDYYAQSMIEDIKKDGEVHHEN